MPRLERDGVDSDETAAAVEAINRLAGSAHRVRILSFVARHRRCHRDELRSRFDVARTTVHRNLDALVEQGWLTNAGREYAITPCGEWVADVLTELVDTVAASRELTSVLGRLPSEEFDLDVAHLVDADLFEPEPGNPYAMLDAHVERLEQFSTGYGLFPFTSLRIQETLHERIVAADARAEIVVERDVAQTYRSNPQFAELFEEMTATDRFDVFVSGEPFPFGLAVIDDVVQIVVDDGRAPHAVLETDSATVRRWATRTYADYRREAKPVTEGPQNVA